MARQREFGAHGWREVSRERPCLGCGHTHGCRESRDGNFICWRVPSSRPRGAGWWHGGEGCSQELPTLAAPMVVKAEALADWTRAHGQGFLRFDYAGHGQSEGDFIDFTISQARQDVMDVLAAVAPSDDLVLVGSSMGGWMSLLVARAMPQRIAGLVGIAAAPDFTEDLMWAGFSEAERAAVMSGWLEQPSDYSDEPYVITRKLIEDGRQNLVLRAPLSLPFPVRLLQGTADVDVPSEVALRLMAHAESPDLRLTLVKGADHRFSTPACLDLVTAAVEEISRLVKF